MKSRIAGLGLLLTCLAGCSSQSPALSTVPSGLKDIESVAEDAYDKALAGDHAAVSADADSIDTAWNTFKTQAMTDGATAGLVASVDAAVSALKTVVTSTAGDLALARSANGVSAPMSGLFALYEDPVPPAVLELDYLGREVVLDARELRFGDASTQVDAIEAGFGTVRDGLVAAGGAAEADDFSILVTKLRADVAAQDGALLETDAVQALDLVDTIETVFTDSAQANGGETPD